MGKWYLVLEKKKIMAKMKKANRKMPNVDAKLYLLCEDKHMYDSNTV